MSEPNRADFALISVLDTAPDTYVKLCGVESVTINRSAQTNETYSRDCAAPNRPGRRKLRVTGSSWSISASGADNIDIEEDYTDAFGVRKTYKIDLFRDDGTDGGELMGTYTGSAIMTARNQGYTDTPGTTELTLEGEGLLTWTVAP